MATTVKNTPATRKKSEPIKPDIIEQSAGMGNKNVEEKVNVKSEASNAKTPKKFEQTDGIICRSITQGGLFMEGKKTKLLYEWDCYGDEVEVEYRDLVAAVRTKSGFVFAPRFIIEDEDFIAEFPQLQKFYEDKFTERELSDILDMDIDEMIQTIRALPSGAKDSIKSLAAYYVSNGFLDSMNKIEALDKEFGVQLELLFE